MRKLPITLVLATLLPAALAAQVRFSVAAGATGGTALVNDRIFQDIKVSQGIAPTFAIGAAFPVSRREWAGLELGLGFGSTRIKETGFSEIDGPGFRTLSLLGTVDGPALKRLGYRFGAGILKYLPDKEGFFRQGGPTLLLLTGGLDYRIPVRTRVSVVARLRYDYQRFSTDELSRIGFSRTQDVHRVGAGLAIEYVHP